MSFSIDDKLKWFGTDEGESIYWETADLWIPLPSPEREESPKSSLNEANGQWGREPQVLFQYPGLLGPGGIQVLSLGQLDQRHWLHRSKLGCLLSLGFLLAYFCFSSNWSPSCPGQQKPVVLVHGHCILSCGSLHPAHSFINSPFIKLSSNFPIWVCHLFLLILILDKVKLKKDEHYSEGPDPQMKHWFGWESHHGIELVVLPGVVGWIMDLKAVRTQPRTCNSCLVKETSQMWLSSWSSWEEYPEGGPDVITSVLMRGKQESQSLRRYDSGNRGQWKWC